MEKTKKTKHDEGCPAVVCIQPALPVYRMNLFERISREFPNSFVLYYSNKDLGEITRSVRPMPWAREIGPIAQPVRGLEWQVGALRIPIKRGDILIVCGAPRAISTLMLLVKARLVGVRSIWWGQYWSATSTLRRHWMRMRLSKLADALLFYTEAEKRRYLDSGWRHGGMIGALNNGIDQSEIKYLRAPYAFEHRLHNILFIGRLTKKARLELLVEALSSSHLASAHLHIVGDGGEEFKLRRQAEELGVSKKITWYGGLSDEKDIAKIANKCSVFVYPGQVGLSLIHAMGYGLPCVVHSNEAHHMPEISAFKHGVNGYVFEEGSSDSLSSSISRILNNPQDCESMAAKNVEVVRTSFNTEDMANRFVKFILEFDGAVK